MSVSVFREGERNGGNGEMYKGLWVDVSASILTLFAAKRISSVYPELTPLVLFAMISAYSFYNFKNIVQGSKWRKVLLPVLLAICGLGAYTGSVDRAATCATIFAVTSFGVLQFTSPRSLALIAVAAVLSVALQVTTKFVWAASDVRIYFIVMSVATVSIFAANTPNTFYYLAGKRTTDQFNS
ncbi:hypothetical protein ACFQ4O_08455 [Methylopila musalis]|uniref:Uncharacterized protein n=1 Tax=Methylopila musalis TaxID=1134781 RepID=A0ABW3Z8C7_9HYPH